MQKTDKPYELIDNQLKCIWINKNHIFFIFLTVAILILSCKYNNFQNKLRNTVPTFLLIMVITYR